MHSLEVVSRYRDSQLQVVIYIILFNTFWRLNTYFIANNRDSIG